jgi:hypothetical protein
VDPPEPLADLDPRSGIPLVLRHAGEGPGNGYWLLEQGDKPVGALDDSEGSRAGWLHTGAGSWRLAVRQPRWRPWAWHVEYAPEGAQPAVVYYPGAVREGGRLLFPDGRRFTLRGRRLRRDWKLLSHRAS